MGDARIVSSGDWAGVVEGTESIRSLLERFFVAVAGNALGMFSAITGDPEFHQILFLFASAFASWKTLSLTMSAFAEELRNGTLELLFLAGLSAWEVFFKPKRFQSPIRLYFKSRKKTEKVRHTPRVFSTSMLDRASAIACQQ